MNREKMLDILAEDMVSQIEDLALENEHEVLASVLKPLFISSLNELCPTDDSLRERFENQMDFLFDEDASDLEEEGV